MADDGVHFITCTIVEWIPVFTSAPYFDILIDSLKYCQKEKALCLHSYVIVENHFHAIVAGPSLMATVQNLKSYTGRRIIDKITQDKKEWLLNQLAFYKLKSKTASQYQVWQEGSHPKIIKDEKMLRQKMEYIHFNPVRRGYVESPEHWVYSSARNYYNENHSVITVDCI
jgi:REP element-mobilizing transposase RayT